uniref:Uncharacterized protein n=1 Tax=Anguilla anguilla TaxID=7936 RepID=A0A0E9QGV4_ANGAN
MQFRAILIDHLHPLIN